MNNLFQSLEVTRRLDTVIFYWRSAHFKGKPMNFLWCESVPSPFACLYLGLFAAGKPLLFKLRELPNIMLFTQHSDTWQQWRWFLQPDYAEGAVRNVLQCEPDSRNLSLARPLASSSCELLTRGGTLYQQRHGPKLTPLAPFPKGTGARGKKAA